MEIFAAYFFGSKPIGHNSVGTNELLAKRIVDPVSKRGEAADFSQITTGTHCLHHLKNEHHRFLTESAPVLINGAIVRAAINVADLITVSAVVLCLVVARYGYNLDSEAVFFVIPFIHMRLVFDRLDNAEHKRNREQQHNNITESESVICDTENK